MDKIIIVFYFGMKNGSGSFNDYEIFKNQVEQYAKNYEGFIFFVLTDYEINFPNVKMECLNPVIKNEIEYEEVLKKLNKIEENIKIANDKK